ncbi:MAG: MBL fold metallo-hydrolase [Bradyrhizobium sp.]
MRSTLLAATATATICLGTIPALAETVFTTLGTEGGPVTAPKRGQPSNLLTVNGSQTLVDVGDGTAQRLSQLALQAGQIENVVITHLHFDHTAGLLGVLGLRFQTDFARPLRVYGPPGTDVLVKGLIDGMAPAMEANYGVPGERSYTANQLVEVHVVKSGDTFQLGDIKITAVQNTHYSFEPGSPKADKFQSLSYRFETPDKVIAVTGDTGPSAEVEKLAKNADILVGEMIDLPLTVETMRNIASRIAPERFEGMKIHLSTHHLAPSDLGKLAANAEAKQLVVTHLAPGGLMTDETTKAYVAEIGRYFSGKITIANDMDRF